ncbi:g5227 [Coccomyxa elongata]
MASRFWQTSTGAVHCCRATLSIRAFSVAQAFLDRFFPRRELFRPLAAFLLRPAPQYSHKIAAFKHKHFTRFTIGLQIRRRKCDFEELHCDTRPSLQSYCDVARSIQLARGIADSEVCFFIAADVPETYPQVTHLLGRERVIFVEDGIVNFSPIRDRGKNPIGNPGSLESALLDMALLSQCDDIVTTFASSFGYVAAAWGGIAPVHMMFGSHESSQNPYWYRALSSEPCYWQAKRLMRDVSQEAVQRFRSNPLWIQYSQRNAAERWQMRPGARPRAVQAAVGRRGHRRGPEPGAHQPTAKAKVDSALDIWRGEGKRVTGFVLSSDGWDDVSGRPLINIVLSTPKGAHFEEAINASGHTKDAAYIAGLWIEQINEVGPEHVSVLITDGAAVNPAAAKLVTAEYPHITWVHCTAHALDLALEDLGKLPLFKDTSHSVRDIVKFINNHQHSHSMFLAKSTLRLLTPGDTRFCTEYIAAARVLQVKSALQETAVSAEFKEWADKQSYKAEAIRVKKLILNEDLWTNIELMVGLFKPIVDLLRLVDSDLATMGKACKIVLGDAVSAKNALLGHAVYVGKEGDFGDPLVIDLAKDMPSYQWWVSNGGEFSELQKVAVRVLAMVSGAGACGRNWSAYDFVHSKKRNRLDPNRARDLVYVFTNMRLGKKSKRSEAFVDWNQGEDETQEEREIV